MDRDQQIIRRFSAFFSGFVPESFPSAQFAACCRMAAE
jgi:hypothetical protein